MEKTPYFEGQEIVRDMLQNNKNPEEMFLKLVKNGVSPKRIEQAMIAFRTKNYKQQWV